MVPCIFKLKRLYQPSNNWTYLKMRWMGWTELYRYNEKGPTSIFWRQVQLFEDRKKNIWRCVWLIWRYKQKKGVARDRRRKGLTLNDKLVHLWPMCLCARIGPVTLFFLIKIVGCRLMIRPRKEQFGRGFEYDRTIGLLDINIVKWVGQMNRTLV